MGGWPHQSWGRDPGLASSSPSLSRRNPWDNSPVSLSQAGESFLHSAVITKQGKLETEQKLSPSSRCQVEDIQGPASEDRLILRSQRRERRGGGTMGHKKEALLGHNG